MVCDNGQCATQCSAGLTACGGGGDGGQTLCVDTATDLAHCGDCSTACGVGQVCNHGQCAATCGAGLVACGGGCIDPFSSRAYCGATAGCGADGGAAGQVCASGYVCSDGSCQLSCQAGLVSCGGACVDPATSRAYCGATAGCGVDGGTPGQSCAQGYVCSGGACALSCQAGLVSCGGSCIDPATNRAYCGATAGCGADGGTPGQSCASGYVCQGGSCQLSCPAGQIACGSACIDPATSLAFCGATAGCGVDSGTAGQACAQGYVCSGGSCQLWCQSGLVACGGNCVDPTSNPAYCGATAGCGADGGTAGQACGQGYVCLGGGCQLSCTPGQVACGGACIDPTTNPAYCGATGGCGVDGGSAGQACATNEICKSGACACVRGCTDGGPPPPPPDGGGQNPDAGDAGDASEAGDGGDATVVPVCTSLTTTGTAVAGTQSSGTVPTGTGGVISDGTYALVAWTFYPLGDSGGLPPPPDGSTGTGGDAGGPVIAWVIQISGVDGGQGKLEQVMTIDTGAAQTSSGTMAASGNDFTFDETCPTTQAVHWTYTATSTNLVLFGGNVVLVFARP
jgi:hypothetical protein